MRIGINCLAIDPYYVGGVRNYTLGLLEGFLSIAEHDFVLLVSEQNQDLFKKYERKNVSTRLVYRLEDDVMERRILWQTVKVKAKALYDLLSRRFYKELATKMTEDIDILYTPTTILFPIHYDKKVTTVLSMHDIQQYHFPQFFTSLQLKDRYITYTLSAENVDYMQASSQFIKGDLLEKFPFLKEEQIKVIPEGVNTSMFAASRGKSDYIFERYSLPPNFLFYPAQLWPHKDHITVLKALLKLKKEHGLVIPLVLTGARYSAANSVFNFIIDNDLNDQVFPLNKVPYADVVALYRHAQFLVTASLHESNCLTILEAAASETPIIASDIPPNIELQEHLQLNIFPKQNAGYLATLLLKIWNDTAMKEKQAGHNLLNIQQYSWENAAKQYIGVFESINKAR